MQRIPGLAFLLLLSLMFIVSSASAQSMVMVQDITGHLEGTKTTAISMSRNVMYPRRGRSLEMAKLKAMKRRRLARPSPDQRQEHSGTQTLFRSRKEDEYSPTPLWNEV